MQLPVALDTRRVTQIGRKLEVGPITINGCSGLYAWQAELIHFYSILKRDTWLQTVWAGDEVDAKSKTITGVILACFVGLGEMLSHGGGVALSKLGKGLEIMEARTPKTSEPVQLLSAAARAASQPLSNANAAQSSVPPPTPTVTSTIPDTPEEAIKAFPGAVVIARRWMVAKIPIPIGAGSEVVCMAVTIEANHALVFYAGRLFPFALGVGVFGAGVTQFESAADVNISIDGGAPEKFLAQDRASINGMTMRVFSPGARTPTIMTSIRAAHFLSISLLGASWNMDLSGSNQAIVALADCAKRT